MDNVWYAFGEWMRSKFKHRIQIIYAPETHGIRETHHCTIPCFLTLLIQLIMADCPSVGFSPKDFRR